SRPGRCGGPVMHTAIFLTALAAANAPAQAAPEPAPPRQPDVVLRWNEVVLQAVKADRTPPPPAARNLALVRGAAYDAVNAADKTHHYYRVDAVLGGPASAEVAAAVAAHRVLVSLYPRQAARFNAALDASLRDVPEGPARERGVRLGQVVAE